ncbi:Type II secretion system protein G precursor [Marinomonas aquimarina]|uniref:Type II secretion system protein G n=1 Tax=Marinomonas aquimarina TaxID=295068 RepID=A0A1A8TGU5_9GAMM|nr:prepilin-type N-terminal cleavage/methylation domain-containing protein [Marinomonas aquimarina]SBS32431.1 Type II secretion system protein G precursor [Marinomonas aquimarina]
MRYKPQRAQHHGFSLLELLLVLSILGVMVSLVAPNMSGWAQQDKAKTEALALQQALQTLIDQSWLAGRNSFIELRQGQLRLWQLQGQQWQEAGVLYEQQAGLEYQLSTVSEQVRNAQESLNLAGSMAWVALANGEYVPLRWHIKSNRRSYTLSGDGINGLQIKP